MRKIALVEFHFEFFFPLIHYFERSGLAVTLWTSHNNIVQKLPEGILGYRSDYAQVGLTGSGERVSGSPDKEIAQVLLEKQEMLLNQTKRFPVFSNWDRNALWCHVLAIAHYWDKILRMRRIDIVLYKTEPHMLFDFILFLVAKQRGIINLFFERLPFDSRVMVCENLEDMRGEIRHRLDLLRESHEKYEATETETASVPCGMKELPFHYKFKRDRAKKRRILSIKSKLAKIGVFGAWRDSMQSKMRRLARDKVLWESIGADQHKALKQPWSVFIMGSILRNVHTLLYKRALGLCNFFLFRGHFEKGGLLFCLPCQPERSSNPCGGPQYFDQIELIRQISDIIGPNKRLFVKEHPSQFSSYQLPERGRSFQFYRDLTKLENVVLLPYLPTAEDLIESAGCVISVGGSACWSALKHGVPAIICGQVAYAACEGALPGRNRHELVESLSKLGQFRTPDPSIYNAASAFESECQRISERAYLDRVYEQRFPPGYDNALVLHQLVTTFLADRSSSHRSFLTRTSSSI